jgi:acyl carrier protein
MSPHDRREDDVDAIVRAELTAVLEKSGKPLPALADDLRLDADLGLTSLDVTTVIVALTDRLDGAGAAATPDVEIATVGDLVRAFRVSAAGATDAASDPVAASRRRAEARRGVR